MTNLTRALLAMVVLLSGCSDSNSDPSAADAAADTSTDGTTDGSGADVRADADDPDVGGDVEEVGRPDATNDADDGSTDAEDAADADVTDPDAGDVDDVDAPDTADAGDATDTGDTADASDTTDTGDTADASDTTDTGDAADASDTTDTGDTPDGLDADAGDAGDTAADTAADAAEVGPVGPEISTVDDQTVVRNTVAPNAAAVVLTVSDPDHEAATLDVTAEVDEPGLVAADGLSVECDGGACTVTVTPLAEVCREFEVLVTVSNPDGDTASTTFSVVPVASALVLNSLDDGEGSLRAALAAAGHGDVVGFGADTFGADQTIALESPLELRDDTELTIDGCDQNPTLAADGTRRVFGAHSGTDYLRRITVTGGASETAGAAVTSRADGNLTVSECVFRDNAVARTSGSSACGGAIAAAGTLRVERSLFVGNTATAELGEASGGAICALAGVRPVSRADVRIVNSTFTDNHSRTTSTGEGFGGAIGIVRDNDISVSHSTFIGNSAATGGGAIRNPAGAVPPTLSHVLVVGNSAPEATDLAGEFVMDSYNIVGDASGTLGIATDGTDATLESLGVGIDDVVSSERSDTGGPTATFSLVPGGPAVDAGDAALAEPPVTDQRGRGFPRIVGVAIDVGAFESSDLPLD